MSTAPQQQAARHWVARRVVMPNALACRVVTSDRVTAQLFLTAAKKIFAEVAMHTKGFFLAPVCCRGVTPDRASAVAE